MFCCVSSSSFCVGVSSSGEVATATVDKHGLGRGFNFFGCILGCNRIGVRRGRSSLVVIGKFAATLVILEIWSVIYTFLPLIL